MRLSFLSPLGVLLLAACANTQAGPYLIDAAPEWKLEPTLVPTPTPPLGGPGGGLLSPSPAPIHKARKGGPSPTETPTATVTPTATPSPTPLSGVYLAPFQDRRSKAEIYSGRSVYEKVVMEPVGATLLAQAWRKRPFSDMSYLWHRQFAYAMGSSGYTVEAAPEPLDDAAAVVAAKLAGAKLLLTGQIKRLHINKRGADDFLGTNFTGTNYILVLELQLKARDPFTGKVLADKNLVYDRLFYDPTRLGARDRDTFPRFFATGLQELALKAAGEAQLLSLAGMPAFTFTPTATITPEVHAPTPGGSPTVQPTATPDQNPYWINPKTGQRVDPNWNFDPSDGTPRDKFILKQPDAKKPQRPTEAK